LWLARPRCGEARLLDGVQLLIDDPVHFLLVVIVIRQAAVDLPQGKVGVLALNLVGVPVVRQSVQGDFEDLRLCADQPQLAVGAFLDVGV
jgi:hypothetical protein